MPTAPIISPRQGNHVPRLIDLGVGHPQNKLLPMDLLQQAAQERFNAGDPYFLQYGARQGDADLRLALANFLSQQSPIEVSAERIFITNGATMGLALVCALFSQPGDTILVEEPTYFLALKVFQDYHLKAIAIPMDENGLDIQALEQALKEYKPSLVYTIPTFQNPSGISLSDERRKRLVELSLAYNFLIIADEVYHFLNYTGTPPKPMGAFIDQGNLISLGSFSKILAPGLRTGWIHTSKAHIDKLKESGLLDSGGGMNPFTSAMLRSVVAHGGLEANLQNLRQSYVQRLNALDQALQRYLPEAQYQTPQGGYFFWIRLPGTENTQTYLAKAKAEHQVLFNPGLNFSSRSGLRDFMRLCFAYHEAPELEEGVRRLQSLFSTFQEKLSSRN